MVKPKNIENQFRLFMEKANLDDIAMLEKVLQGAIQMQNKEARTYLNGLMDFQGHMISEDTYEGKITLNPLLMNPLNIVHGGITATFADSVMGSLLYELLPEHEACVTSEIKINYLKPGFGKHLLCRATLAHKGKHICVVQADLFREDGVKIALATGSFFIIPRPDYI